MLHYTSEPNKTEMYKIRDEQNSPPESDELNDFGPGELVAIYCQNQAQYQYEQVCFILLQNLDKENHAVRKMKRKDATHFNDFTSFNIQAEQKVLAVPKDQGPSHSIIPYNQTTGHFEFQYVDQIEDMSELQNSNGPALNYRGSSNNHNDRNTLIMVERTA